MAYEEQHQIVAEEEARQKELMEKRKAELSQLLEEVEKTEQTRSRKPSIHQGLHSGRSSQQSIVSHGLLNDRVMHNIICNYFN